MRYAKKIFVISYADWQKMGFSKGTLHYMKKNTERKKPFTLNKHVRERLDQWVTGDQKKEGIVLNDYGR
jgi:hypothetical protein